MESCAHQKAPVIEISERLNGFSWKRILVVSFFLQELFVNKKMQQI